MTPPPPTTYPVSTRLNVVIEYVTLVGISAHAGFIGLFWWLQVPLLAAFNVFSVLAWVAARMLNRRGREQVSVGLIVGEVVLHAVLAVSLLGWNSGFHYYLIALVPFVMFNDRLPLRLVTLVSTLVALVYLGLRATTFTLSRASISPQMSEWLQYLNIAVPFLALVVICGYYRSGSVEVERRMQELAMTDSLTRLPNRRRMLEALEDHRVRFARNAARPFGVVIGDIDGFKQINDTQGHAIGDQVLKELAPLLRSKVRAQDLVARWGGEEFLFLLTETDLQGSSVVAEKLRAAVEDAGVPFGSQPLKVTMTFGVSVFDQAMTLDECIRRADHALYAGKSQGKNRVVVAGGEKEGRWLPATSA